MALLVGAAAVGMIGAAGGGAAAGSVYAYRRYRANKKSKVFGKPLADFRAKRLKNDLPLIVCDTINFIEQHGLVHKHIFRKIGEVERVRALVEKYDTEKHVDIVAESPYDVAAALKCFLYELPEPLFTSEGCQRFIAIEKRHFAEPFTACFEDSLSSGALREWVNDVKEVFRALHPRSQLLSMVLIRMLRVVASQSESNDMSALALGNVMASTLFFADSDDAAAALLEEEQTIRSFLSRLIRLQPFVFPE